MKTRFLILCLLIPCTTFGEIYKWVDQNGQTHYGQQPESPASKIIILPKQKNIPQNAGVSEKQRLENIKKWADARQQEREKEKQEKRALEEERLAKKKRCNSLRNDLKDMQAGGVWYHLDDQGERQYYSAEELDSRMEAMRTRLKKNCT